MSKLPEAEIQQIEAEKNKLSEQIDELITNFKNTYKDKIGLMVERNMKKAGDTYIPKNNPHIIFTILYEGL